MSIGAAVFAVKNRMTDRISHLDGDAKKNFIMDGCYAKIEWLTMLRGGRSDNVVHALSTKHHRCVTGTANLVMDFQRSDERIDWVKQYREKLGVVDWLERVRNGEE
ncbi:Hypothetical protein CINCED_3A001892 [Cinara cedri]|uniref:Uncharacterized protein n=1 Tax=Cinara cedri TaxID=506608 RepID=A0A5E4MK51_9HEMI|nr:Hypothetical protein CINCED_3A001892 [Cinara cedri]